MVNTRADVHSHWPNLVIFRITIRVNFRVGVTVWLSSSVVATTRCSATARPVHSSHVQIYVVGNLNVRIVFLDPFLSPVVTASLTAFFAGPQAEYHCITSTIPGHCFSHGQYHTCPRCVIVCTYACTVGSLSNQVR